MDTGVGSDASVNLLPQDWVRAWSVGAFALAVQVAKAGASFASPATSERVSLDIAQPASASPLAIVPVRLAAGEVKLALSEAALIHLLERLHPGADLPRDAAHRVSADAVEALVAALLAPLAFEGVGRAHFPQTPRRLEGAVLALGFGTQTVPILGDVPVLVRVAEAVDSQMQPAVTSPSAYLRGAERKRAAVELEAVCGWVRLDRAARAAMEPGGALVLDSFWSQSRPLVAQRFLGLEDGRWIDAPFLDNPIRVRTRAAISAFDHLSADRLLDHSEALTRPSAETVELVEGSDVIATGRLVAIQGQDIGPQIVVAIDTYKDTY